MEILGDNDSEPWGPAFPYNSDPPSPGYAAQCADEDANEDGFLDLVTEDINGNGTMEAGNRATVVGIPANADSDACGDINQIGGAAANTTITTNSGGFARVCVIYAQSDNLWVEVRLKALLSVFGSEFQQSSVFILDALADDLNDPDSAPAGQFSPFGDDPGCDNDD
jgi:hypothetical protein